MKKNCNVCKFVKKDQYKMLYCDELKVNLDIELQTGYDGGYVKRIYLPENFYCSFFKKQL